MAGEDNAYAKWIRSLPCSVCAAWGSVIHHKTGAGVGKRAHDHDGMPLCRTCHDDFHGLHGFFSDWKKDELREWQGEEIRKLRFRWAMMSEAEKAGEAF